MRSSLWQVMQQSVGVQSESVRMSVCLQFLRMSLNRAVIGSTCFMVFIGMAERRSGVRAASFAVAGLQNACVRPCHTS